MATRRTDGCDPATSLPRRRPAFPFPPPQAFRFPPGASRRPMADPASVVDSCIQTRRLFYSGGRGNLIVDLTPPQISPPQKANSLPSKHGCELDLRPPQSRPVGKVAQQAFADFQIQTVRDQLIWKNKGTPPPLPPAIPGRQPVKFCGTPVASLLLCSVIPAFCRILFRCPDRNTLCQSPPRITAVTHSVAIPWRSTFPPAHPPVWGPGVDSQWDRNLPPRPSRGRDRMGPYQEGAQP